MLRNVAATLALALALAACGQLGDFGFPSVHAGRTADGLPRGYELLFSPAPHAFRFSAPTEPARRGEFSERFELRDGDCGGSDCPAGRMRAEIRKTDDALRARRNRDIWYGWSFYNQSIPSMSRDRTPGLVFGQWKFGGDQAPVFRLVQTAPGTGHWDTCDPTICNPEGDSAMDVVIELEDMRATHDWGPAQNFGNICRLFSLDRSRGKWVDIVVNTNFSTGTDGYLRVWIDGALRCNYFGRLVADPTGARGERPSHRRGIFASYPDRWRRSQGDRPIPTMVAYYDEFLVGRDRAGVDTRLRETSAAPAKD